MDPEELKRLQDDIRAVRATVERNRGLIRALLLPQRFRIFSIISGLVIIAFCWLLYSAETAYGGLHNMPGWMQWLVYGSIAALVIAASIFKNRSEVRAARHLDPDYSFWTLHREFLRRPLIAHSLLSSLLILAGLCVYLAQIGQPASIVPLTALVVGLIYNIYGAMAGVALYYLPGYWFIASGLFTVFVGPVHALLSIAYVFGAGYIAFGLAIFVGGRKED